MSNTIVETLMRQAPAMGHAKILWWGQPQTVEVWFRNHEQLADHVCRRLPHIASSKCWMLVHDNEGRPVFWLSSDDDAPARPDEMVLTASSRGVALWRVLQDQPPV